MNEKLLQDLSNSRVPLRRKALAQIVVAARMCQCLRGAKVRCVRIARLEGFAFARRGIARQNCFNRIFDTVTIKYTAG